MRVLAVTRAPTRGLKMFCAATRLIAGYLPCWTVTITVASLINPRHSGRAGYSYRQHIGSNGPLRPRWLEERKIPMPMPRYPLNRRPNVAEPQIEYVDVLIDPSDIILKKTDYDEKGISELAAMIAVSGLQNPPIIRDDRTIVAGSRRVLAAIKAGLNPIRVHTVAAVTAEAVCEEISLHENLGRDNLQWYDQVILHKRLHELRQSIYGAGKPGRKSGWSLRDTAAELKMGLGNLSEDIRLADAIMADPTLRKIQDKSTALRIILAEQKRVVAELATSLPPTIEYNQLIHGSSEEVLRAVPDNTFDCCITDPPWLEYKDNKLTKDEFTFSVFMQIYRTLKHDAFLYAFVSTDDFYIYISQLRDIGFSVQKWPLIWAKENSLSLGSRSWNYQRDYEPILLAVKGSPALTQNMLSSVQLHAVVPPARLVHPNEKPVQIIKNLLEHSTYEGSFVLDPFAGSGVVGVAATQLRRKYMLIERDSTYYSRIKDRLK